MKIHNKAKFYELWETGCLGNRTRIWHDPRDARAWALAKSKQTGRDIEIGFREVRLNRAGGAGKWQKVPWYDVLATAAVWKMEGRCFIMDDGAPDNYRTLQGELVRTERGMEGFLSLGSKLPMRPDIAAGNMRHYSYLATVLLLKQFMDPASREDVDALFELYPDAAIEFTCFTVNAGIIPGRNTIFWETRNY